MFLSINILSPHPYYLESLLTIWIHVSSRFSAYIVNDIMSNICITQKYRLERFQCNIVYFTLIYCSAEKEGEGTAIESCTGVEVGNTTEFMLVLSLEDCSEFGSERFA